MSKSKTKTPIAKNLNKNDMPDLWMSEKIGLDIKADMTAEKDEDDFMSSQMNYIEILTQDLSQID